jgi:shikimate dehydrogenase
MMNALLAKRGQLGDVVLVPMCVAENGLAACVGALRHVRNFRGAIVSMPHKTAMTALIDELAGDAAIVGAVNVIRREDDGRLVGAMFDGEGFVGGLAGVGHRVIGARCLLAGSGGAAAAVAFALARHGCASLCIVNRTRSKASALAERVQRVHPRVEVTTAIAPGERFDIAINGTSLGMRADDAMPLPGDVIERCSLVAECVIAPEFTRLLEVARQRGGAIHTGVPMLAAQLEMMLDFIDVG